MNSKSFFTSDTHFGHGNIIKYCNRPFLSLADKEQIENNQNSNYRHKVSEEAVKKMDDELIDQINSIVRENDTLYHLGDFALPGKNDYYRKCKEYRDRIICRNIILIWGNHDDRCISDLFSETYDLKKITSRKIFRQIVLCHYAMAIWDGSHKNDLHLYGHSHGDAESMLNSAFPNRNSMDVGVDNAFKILGSYRPFSEEEIRNRFN